MLVVTPNLTFDVTVRVPILAPGSVTRAADTRLTCGGKGVNVVRSSRALGVRGTRLLAFLPDSDGDRLADLLADEAIELIPVAIAGAVRVCTIFLEAGGRTTVVNGPGPRAAVGNWTALVQAAEIALRPGEVLVCDGSLPPGSPVDSYARMVDLAHAKGSPAVVDAAPDALNAALTRRPDLVCPNLSEAEGLLHGRLDEQVDERGGDISARAIAAALALRERGALRAVVTAGAAGAALAGIGGAWWFTVPSVPVTSTIGAGDTFVGSAAPALAAGRSDVEIVVEGLAAASASVAQQLAGGVDPARATELASLIKAIPVPAETAGLANP